MTEISALTVVCVVISTLISVCVPLVYLIYGKGKLKGSLLAAIWSLLVFLAVFVLQALIWSSLDVDTLLTKLLGTDKSEGIIASIRCVYMALIETAGMLVYFVCSRKRRNRSGDALIFGAGYAFWICFTYTALLVMTLLVVIANAMGKELSFTLSRLYVDNKVVAKETVGFLFYGIRSLFDCAFYISAAVMLFSAVQMEIKWPIFVLFFLHILHSLPTALHTEHVWYWGNDIIAMIGVGVVTVITTLLAYKLYLDNQKAKENV